MSSTRDIVNNLLQEFATIIGEQNLNLDENNRLELLINRQQRLSLYCKVEANKLLLMLDLGMQPISMEVLLAFNATLQQEYDVFFGIDLASKHIYLSRDIAIYDLNIASFQQHLADLLQQAELWQQQLQAPNKNLTVSPAKLA